MGSSVKNEEAELSILGSVLLEPEALDRITDLSPRHFTTADRSAIYAAMLAIHDAGEKIDPVTVRARDSSISKKMTDFLCDYTFTAANIGYYVKLVKDSATRRDLVAACEAARDKAVSTRDIKEAVDAAEASVLAVRTDDHRKAGVSVQEALRSAYRDIQLRHEKKGEIIGLATGFADLDSMTTGLQNGDLILLAARPSMGKTAFALNIAEHVCRAGKSVQIFSLEMSASQLVQRGLSSVARVNAQTMRTGNFADGDWPRMANANEIINRWKLRIEDGFSQTLLDIRAAARRQSRTADGVDLIIIDYLQLINSHDRHQSREQEVANMSRSLKQLAKELNVPIMVLAQLNRGLESRDDKRPRNSDLRESGSLEQDADVIIFMHRESYFCPDCKKQGSDCGEGHYNTAEAIISKQRNGPTGIVRLAWFGELCKFADQNNRREI